MTLRTFLLIIGINTILILVANSSQARPTNYCTNNQYSVHVDKIAKTESLLTKWAEISTILDSIDPGLQAAVKADSRYKRMLAKVSTVTTLKQTHETAKDVCILETNLTTGQSSTDTITNSSPTYTSTYIDSTAVTTNGNGSTVTTVTRTTTVTSNVTRTTTTTVTPYTTYTYNNGETETINVTATSSSTEETIVSVGSPTNETISTTIVANQVSSETTYEIT